MRAASSSSGAAGLRVGAARACARSAFTYIELLVASAVLFIVITGLVASNLFGMRMEQIVIQRNDAEHETKRVISLITRDIQSARSVYVNNGGWPRIQALTNSVPRQGNALQLNLEFHPTTGLPTSFILYELDTNDHRLYRSESEGVPVDICGPVTNTVVFLLANARDLTNAVVATTGRTNDAMSSLVQVRLQLSSVGGETATVDLGAAAFVGNEIRCIVAHRNSSVFRN